MIGALADLVGPTLLGALLVHALLRRAAHPPGIAQSLALGAPLGLGLFSLTMYGAHMAGLPLRVWPWLDTAACLAGLCLGWRWLRSAARAVPGSPPTQACALRVSAAAARLITAALVLCVVGAALVLALRLQASPHGDWDAWAIWNLHARFLLRAPGPALGYLDPALEWSHPDYPLHLPLLVLRSWLLGGQEHPAITALLGPAFLAAMAALLLIPTRPGGAPLTGRLAALTLLSTPVVILLAGGRLADTPLACCTLVSAACCHAAIRQQEPRYMALAGLAAGLAAWTKNEGLYLQLALLPVALAPLLRRPRGPASRSVAWLLAGLALPDLALLHLWQKVGGFAGSVRAGLDLTAAWGNLRSADRHLSVLGALLSAPLELDTWAGGPVVTLLYPAATGLHPDARARRATLAVAALLLGLLALQYLTFVVIPGDQRWYLDSALDRLLQQVYPALLFLLFSAGRPLSAPRGSAEG